MSKTIESHAKREHIPLGAFRVSPAAQREFIQPWGDWLVENFDIELMEPLTASKRDGVYWIVDGQHSHYGCVGWAKREFGDDWAEWTVEARVREGLSEQSEAELFLALNNRRGINAFDKFRVGVTAGLPIPTSISRVVSESGLRIEKGTKPGSVSAVGALDRVYRTGGADLLANTLRPIRDAWAGAGLEADTIKGVAMFVNRFEGRYTEERLVKKLAAIAGSKSLKQRAYTIKEAHGATMEVAHAAAVTDVYNTGARGTQSLGSWWRGAS